jgi:pimeloyl-ACP methyl ester carboxylesterase
MNLLGFRLFLSDRLGNRAGSSRKPVAIAVAALLAFSLLPAPAFADHVLADVGRPTIVLVHGAWAGPSAWDQIRALLRKDGYETVAPTLNLVSLADDAATVAGTLDQIAGKKILVGHSYGGMVISNAATGRTDVLALVFTAGFVPEEGESAFSVQEGFKETEAVHHLIFDPFPFASIDPAFFPQIFAQDLSPKKAAELNAGQRPTSLGALIEFSGPIAWDALPSWYAVSGEDLVIDPAATAVHG